jgi:hypothetical protein
VKSSTNRPSTKARNAGVEAGIDKHITGTVTIGGVTYTPATLKQVFLDEDAAMAAADALHTQWRDQVQVTKATRAQASVTYVALRAYLIGLYGKKANAVLNDFAMIIPKPTGTTKVATKAAAAEKGKATREVRNTKGSVQKKALKGVIEVPVKAVTTITPLLPSSTATSEPASATTPAPALPSKPVS